MIEITLTRQIQARDLKDRHPNDTLFHAFVDGLLEGRSDAFDQLVATLNTPGAVLNGPPIWADAEWRRKHNFCGPLWTGRSS